MGQFYGSTILTNELQRENIIFSKECFLDIYNSLSEQMQVEEVDGKIKYLISDETLKEMYEKGLEELREKSSMSWSVSKPKNVFTTYHDN